MERESYKPSRAQLKGFQIQPENYSPCFKKARTSINCMCPLPPCEHRAFLWCLPVSRRRGKLHKEGVLPSQTSLYEKALRKPTVLNDWRLFLKRVEKLCTWNPVLLQPICFKMLFQCAAFLVGILVLEDIYIALLQLFAVTAYLHSTDRLCQMLPTFHLKPLTQN